MSRSDAGSGMDDDFWEVSSQAARLTQYACEIGAHYLGDDILRARFVHEIAYVGKAIVDDVSAGRVSAKEGQEALEQEYLELLTGMGALKIGGGCNRGSIASKHRCRGVRLYSWCRLVLRSGAWRLFRYVRADKTQALKTMSTHSIVFEVGIDMLTGEQVRVELRDR